MTTIEQFDIEARFHGESLDMNRDLVNIPTIDESESDPTLTREDWALHIAENMSDDKTLIHIAWVDDPDCDTGFPEPIYTHNGFFYRAVDTYGPCGCHSCVGKLFNAHNREIASTMCWAELTDLTYHDGQYGHETFNFE